jgi:hypothetical protein
VTESTYGGASHSFWLNTRTGICLYPFHFSYLRSTATACTFHWFPLSRGPRWAAAPARVRLATLDLGSPDHARDQELAARSLVLS